MAALTQTVPRPLTSASVCPGASVIPSRTPSILTTPPTGVRIVTTLWTRPLRSVAAIWRSEEHTSELQSLMRISYAVFCLKQKKHTEHLLHALLRTIFNGSQTAHQ